MICPQCLGYGDVCMLSSDSAGRPVSFRHPCPRCNGEGHVSKPAHRARTKAYRFQAPKRKRKRAP